MGRDFQRRTQAMTTYWTYKRDGDPLKLDVITAGGVDFCSRSFYAGKPIRGNVLELSDAQLQTVIEEVGKRVIVNHAQVANAKSVIVGGIADGGEPLGRHL